MNLNYVDAYSLLNIAESKYNNFKVNNVDIRFGQVLWTVLPESVLKSIVNTEYDFYELSNKNDVVELFLKGCVE